MTAHGEKPAMSNALPVLQDLLDELMAARPDLEAAAVFSSDGVARATVLPAGLDVDRLGAMSAAMLALGDRTAQALARGELAQVMIKGQAGYLLMTQAGPEAVLTVLCGPEAPLGRVFHDVAFTAARIGQG
jgi:predicted regulator of Ras-like GTPase activity (Roadblock/LC7/MglB family)